MKEETYLRANFNKLKPYVLTSTSWKPTTRPRPNLVCLSWTRYRTGRSRPASTPPSRSSGSAGLPGRGAPPAARSTCERSVQASRKKELVCGARVQESECARERTCKRAHATPAAGGVRGVTAPDVTCFCRRWFLCAAPVTRLALTIFPASAAPALLVRSLRSCAPSLGRSFAGALLRSHAHVLVGLVLPEEVRAPHVQRGQAHAAGELRNVVEELGVVANRDLARLRTHASKQARKS